MKNCKGCDQRDETINHHADTINQLKREKMAYRAALVEVSAGKDFKEIFQRHAERLGA